MPERKNLNKLNSVMSVSYTTDKEFDSFLKMLIHNYLSVDQAYIQMEKGFVDKVDSKSVEPL